MLKSESLQKSWKGSSSSSSQREPRNSDLQDFSAILFDLAARRGSSASWAQAPLAKQALKTTLMILLFNK